MLEPNTPVSTNPPAPLAEEEQIVFHGEDTETPETPEPTETLAEEVATETTPLVGEKEQISPPSPPITLGAEAPKPPTDIQQLTQLFSQQQALIREQSEALARQQDAAELAQLRAAWEGQGYAEEQIAAGLTQHAQLKQRERTIAQREQVLNQTLSQHQAEINAKVTVAMQFAEKYGMPFVELMKFDNPYIMEAKAEAYQSRQALAKAQQAKVKPHKLDIVGPGQQGATSRARLLDAYNAGEKLTLEQEAVLFGSR